MLAKCSLLFCCVLFFACAATARAEGGELPTGRVLEKVSVAADPMQHYALYLPSAYARAHRYPVLYCFDPGGRGALPVERFREAAEKFGYIVVGSNNSRNGADVNVSDIFRKLWDDTHARLSIDDRRVYLAGFSGGARLALSAAYSLAGAVAGVVACSGGFPTRQRPLSPPSFALFGTAGVGDFNNPEMRELFRAVEGAGAPTRLAFFAGGHEWPPLELCAEAVEWLELQAMRKGLREKSEAFVSDLFGRVLAGARAAEAAGDLYRAYSEYTRLAEDFRGLSDVSEAERASARLKTTKEVARALKREKELEEAQRRREQEFSDLFGALRRPEERTAAAYALKRAAGELKKAAASAPEGDEAVLARRLFGLLLVEAFEQGSASVLQKDYLAAAASFSVGTELQPDNPRAFYHLARAYALAKDAGRALEALRAAAGKGFADAEALAAPEFAGLRDDRRFREVSEAVAKNLAAKGSR